MEALQRGGVGAIASASFYTDANNFTSVLNLSSELESFFVSQYEVTISII